ncbi:MAG: flavodoxin domain-containing protein [Candidatus Promineifilaceae bacterium]|nr:flavodoxin domain-containing protein [Candidatus Promineifilaceae bacterium]
MAKILVAYATMAGSTAEVAEVVAEELVAVGFDVDLLALAGVQDLDDYDAVVVGEPMILGWHRGARRFLRKHRAAFQRIPLAVFVTAMSLTAGGERNLDGVPVFVDEQLPKAPAREGRLSLRERYARLSSYLRPILRAIRPAKPVSIAVFGGRMEYGRLPWWAVLFAVFIVRAPAGDRRNWPVIRAWAAELPGQLRLEVEEVEVV